MNIGNVIRIVMVFLLVMLARQAQAKLFKIATLSPDGSVWMKKMKEGAFELAQKTNNRVRIKYYPAQTFRPKNCRRT